MFIDYKYWGQQKEEWQKNALTLEKAKDNSEFLKNEAGLRAAVESDYKKMLLDQENEEKAEDVEAEEAKPEHEGGEPMPNQ
jgi:hypothetical protein